MAVGGLQNVSVYDSAFLRESQSPASRQWREPERPNSRASSVLQMWRELEGEHVVSHSNLRLEELPRRLGSETSGSDQLSSRGGSVNGDGSPENVVQHENELVACSLRLVDSDNEHEDNSSFCSELSTDLGETERDRVRQVFREWMSSGAKNHLPNASHRNNRSRSPWLGQNERERVRIIREWVQINTQQRGSNDSPRDDFIAEIGSQIEQVRDGQLVHREVAERRPLRKLCGRQALLDMLVRAQTERKEEINKLLQDRPVSDFSHRNRIQTLLKGRFLQNQRLVQDDRPACTAVNELGLLRQRHTVSDLRDGFLSRLGFGSVNGVQCDSLSNNDLVDLRNGQPRSSNEQENEGETDQYSEHVNSQTENVLIPNSQNNDVQNVNTQHILIATDAEVQGLGNNNREDETSNIELVRARHSGEDDNSGSVWQGNNREGLPEQDSNTIETVPTHFLEAHSLYNADNSQNVDVSEQVSGDLEAVHTRLLEACPNLNANNPHNVDAAVDHIVVDPLYSMAGELPLHDLVAHVEELQGSDSEPEENELLQFSGRENSELTEVNLEDSMLQETSSQWYHDLASNVVMEQTPMQESDEEWTGNVLQEAIDSWLDVPSGEETMTAERAGPFYFPDEENIQSTELRQLLSRRRVSTLLRSGFRESLDQLIQSYVRRQNDASAEWDIEEVSSSHASLEQEEEPQHHIQNPDQDPRWGQELQNDDWSDLNPHQHTGDKWEIINELRLDMARLLQRMNNMQNTLETCMDLQLELQSSLQLEVSAALNRSLSNSTDNAQITMDDSRWDRVRQGICCICCNSQIDTLLYRCGHMCTCSKCAEGLLQGRKCPMCYAPVVEVVRAYFIQ